MAEDNSSWEQGENDDALWQPAPVKLHYARRKIIHSLEKSTNQLNQSNNKQFKKQNASWKR